MSLIDGCGTTKSDREKSSAIQPKQYVDVVPLPKGYAMIYEHKSCRGMAASKDLNGRYPPLSYGRAEPDRRKRAVYRAGWAVV